MKKDKKTLYMMALTMFLVVAGVIAFGYAAIQQDELNLQTMIWIGIVLLVLIFSTIIFIIRLREIKKGVPLEDERSKKILLMATSKSFIVTLYWLLAISTFEKFFAGLAGLEHLTASQTVGGGIFGMLVAFIAFWLYYNKKANI